MWTVYDTMAAPGTTAEVSARCERRLGFLRIFRRGVPARIEFAGRAIETVTRAGGYATVRLEAPREPGPLEVRAGEGEAACGTLWVVPADRAILITDLDKTVSAASAWGFWLRPIERVRPYEGAVEALARAATRRQIVYVTARRDLLAGKTRAWHRRYGLPPGPVFLRHPGAPGRTDEAFKTAAVGWIKGGWPRVEWGIGDKAGDMRAYRAHRIPSIRFRAGRAPPREEGAVAACASWQEVRRLLED